MERRTRVYPVQRRPDRWISMAALGLAALLVMTGVFSNPAETELSVQPLATAAPMVMEESFDETPASCEVRLPAIEWYTLQLGAFEEKAAAEALAEQFIGRGAAGYVWQDGRYRVLAAAYPLKEDAQQVRERLLEQHEIESWLYQVKMPEIHVRLSGMQGQLDILQAALLHANELLNALQEMSVAMDRRELTVPEMKERLAGMDQTLSTVAVRLRQRFSPPRHAAVEGLIRCFELHSGFVQKLEDNAAQVETGSRVKCHTLETLHALKKIYDTLSHT